jgi:DNA-binding beta-propeller fold protein YncE
MSANIGFRYHQTIGLLAQTGRGFSLPVDFAFGQDGLLYVLNRGTPVQRNTHVTICTVDADYRADFGAYGTGDGQWIWPTAIAVDREGCVYIGSESEHRVQKFSANGQFLSKWGALGERDGELNGPSGMVFDREDNLYVVDQHNNRIQKFTKDGKFLLKWGQKGEGEGQFNLPWGIGLDAAGNVYVADWYNDRVQKFDPEGKFLAVFGKPGHGDGEFHRPSSVAVDGEGNIYVADWGNNRVQVLGPDGSFRTKLLGDAGLSKWAAEYLPSNPDYMEQRAAARNREVERFLWGPTSVKFDAQGLLYICDSCRYRLQVYRRVY